jgi:UDP-N-acetylmuramate dehydrogenase
LHLNQSREVWEAERLGFGYRTSYLKENPGEFVVLSAVLRLRQETQEAIKERTNQYLAYRRKTQPPGASMGSMFKNPPGDYAGRLIEAAGLKGTRIGDAEISRLHANFFINHGKATAQDVLQLILKAKKTVAEKFELNLELEIELVGDWTGYELG